MWKRLNVLWLKCWNKYFITLTRTLCCLFVCLFVLCLKQLGHTDTDWMSPHNRNIVFYMSSLIKYAAGEKRKCVLLPRYSQKELYAYLLTREPEQHWKLASRRDLNTNSTKHMWLVIQNEHILCSLLSPQERLSCKVRLVKLKVLKPEMELVKGAPKPALAANHWLIIVP